MSGEFCMTIEEKSAAFDLIAMAFTNLWHDGSWTWWCYQSCGGLTKRNTQEEAIADLIEWSKETAAWNAKRFAARMRVRLPVGLPMSSQPGNGGQLHGQGDGTADDPGRTPIGDSGGVRRPGDIPGSPDSGTCQAAQGNG